MINYVNKPHSFDINSIEEDMLVTLMPLHGALTADNPLWNVRDQYDVRDVKTGDYRLYKCGSKYLWVIYITWFEEAPSTSLYENSRELVVDTQLNRIKKLKSSLKDLHQFCIDNNIKSIASSTILCGIYKDTTKKHLKDVEYFIKYIEPVILGSTTVDWTVYNRVTKVHRKDKTNNLYTNDNFNQYYESDNTIPTDSQSLENCF